MEKVNVNANEVIAKYREQVDQLNFENTVLRLQVTELQKQAQPTTEQTSGAQEVVNKEDK